MLNQTYSKSLGNCGLNGTNLYLLVQQFVTPLQLAFLLGFDLFVCAVLGVSNPPPLIKKMKNIFSN